MNYIHHPASYHPHAQEESTSCLRTNLRLAVAAKQEKRRHRTVPKWRLLREDASPSHVRWRARLESNLRHGIDSPLLPSGGEEEGTPPPWQRLLSRSAHLTLLRLTTLMTLLVVVRPLHCRVRQESIRQPAKIIFNNILL